MPRAVLFVPIGVAVGLAATIGFDLKVHSGLQNLTGASRLIVAALGGAVCGGMVDQVFREHFWI